MENVAVNLYSIVGNSFCVAAEDGEKVYKARRTVLQNQKNVKLSFKNVEMVTTAFLNSAIGQLYNGEFDFKLLTESLSVIDISNDDKQSIKRVVDTAKLYYSNPDRLNETIRKVMEE